MSDGPELFDADALYSTLQEVETHLGYLKASEAAYEYLQNAVYSSSGTQVADDEEIVVVEIDPEWTFPCPDPRYAIHPTWAFYTMHVHTSGGANKQAEAEEWVRKVKAGTEAAYRGGLGWAAGFAAYANSLCEQITKPSAYSLDYEARTLKGSVVDSLGSMQESDWGQLTSVLDDWKGNANSSFQDFYFSVEGKLKILTTYTGYIYAGMCAMTKIVAGAQNGLVKYAESADRGVKDQLSHWVSQGQPPQDSIETPQWIGDLLQLATDALPFFAKVPALATITGAATSGLDTKGGLEAIAVDLGANPTHNEVPFRARDCEELYTEITGSLRKYANDFHRALDRVASGELPKDRKLDGATTYNPGNVQTRLETQRKRASWTIPTVNDKSAIATTNPEHDTDHDGVDDRASYD